MDLQKDWSRHRRVHSSTSWRRTIGRTYSDFEGEWFSDRKGRKRLVSCRPSTFFPSKRFRCWRICNPLDAKWRRIHEQEILCCLPVLFENDIFSDWRFVAALCNQKSWFYQIRPVLLNKFVVAFLPPNLRYYKKCEKHYFFVSKVLLPFLLPFSMMI